MKRWGSMLLVVVMMFSLSACGNKKEIEIATNRGMQAMENGDYQEAIEFFDEALDLGSENKETKALYSGLKDYLKAATLFSEQDDCQGTLQLLAQIDETEQANETFKKAVDELKQKVEQRLEEKKQEEAAKKAAEEKAAADKAAAEKAAQSQAVVQYSQEGRGDYVEEEGWGDYVEEDGWGDYFEEDVYYDDYEEFSDPGDTGYDW